jgi:hypothetical protein
MIAKCLILLGLLLIAYCITRDYRKGAIYIQLPNVKEGEHSDVQESTNTKD